MVFSLQGTKNRKKANYRQFKTFFHFSKCTSILFLFRAMAFSISITCFTWVLNSMILGVNFFCLQVKIVCLAKLNR